MASCIAVIPAKAYSARFPGKNIALLANKPLIAWAIECAQQSKVFDKIMVSTDDDQITNISRQAGAEVPYRRDACLTQDTIEVPTVVRHVLEWYQKNQNLTFDWVCILQPTSPLRTAHDIIESKKLFEQNQQTTAVVSVSRYHHHPYWALKIDQGWLKPDQPQNATQSRQHLPDLLHPDGTVIWWKTAELLTGKWLYAGHALAYHTPTTSMLDIDYPEDLAYAQWRTNQRS